MLTSLSKAEANSSLLEVSIILPYYSFLRSTYENDTTPLTVLEIPIASKDGKSIKRVKCQVDVLEWFYNPWQNFLEPVLEHPDHARDGGRVEQQSIKVYLIGPGDQSPFDVAFRAKDAGDIYSAYKPLQQEWKDLWFAKAVATAIVYLNNHAGAVKDPRSPVEVVHLHGATNAMVAYHLRQLHSSSADTLRQSPAIVYTLHDSLDEVEYSNLAGNVVRFLDPVSTSFSSPSDLTSTSATAARSRLLSNYNYSLHRRQLGYTSADLPVKQLSALTPLEPWIHSERQPRSFWPSWLTIDRRELFTSSLGIDLADQITLVSKSIASSIVDGGFQFSLGHLVLPSLTYRASLGDFTGVTNGLDFTQEQKNPWTSRSLATRGLAFPRVGATNLTDYTSLQSENNPDHESDPISFLETKFRAKQYLIRRLPEKFSEEDLTRPIYLFIGRFQYNKGCQFFEPILKSISSGSSSNDARLVVMGAENNYPIGELQRLQRRYPRHFTLIYDAAFQEEWGTIIRMASDFALVPSFSESFGLVAAEGLLFGAEVISSGVGGLTEFLVPTRSFPSSIKDSSKEGNSYLFSIFDPVTKSDSTLGSIDLTLPADKSRPTMKELTYGVTNCVESVSAATEAWRRRADRSQTTWLVAELNVRRMIKAALDLEWGKERGPVDEVSDCFSILCPLLPLTILLCEK